MIKKKYIEIEQDNYINLNIDNLLLNVTLPFDVFTKDRGIIRTLIEKGSLFTEETKKILKEKDLSEVLVLKSDVPLLEDYLLKKSIKRQKEENFNFKDYSLKKEKYFQIEKDILLTASKLDFSLYILEESDFKEILRASEKKPAEIGRDRKLNEIAGDLFIKKEDIPLYHAYISSLLEKEDSLSIKTLAIKEGAKVLVKELLDNPRSGEKIKEVNKVVHNLIECITENKDAIYNLLSLRCYDYYTYTHSVNVCTLSVGLGLAIDLRRGEIENLGVGSMLHDIGKSEIPHEILNKQGNLSDREYKIIKTHVLAGERILRSYDNISEDSLYAVLQHHEKLTGKGYPLGLKGRDIKLFGRITAIADCYDALTTQRPYKKAFTPYLALSVIVRETGDYDPELLKVFIKMLGKVT